MIESLLVANQDSGEHESTIIIGCCDKGLHHRVGKWVAQQLGITDEDVYPILMPGGLYAFTHRDVGVARANCSLLLPLLSGEQKSRIVLAPHTDCINLRMVYGEVDQKQLITHHLVPGVLNYFRHILSQKKYELYLVLVEIDANGEIGYSFPIEKYSFEDRKASVASS